MTLKLKPHQVCHHTNCPCQQNPAENGYCQGMNPNRTNFFECTFVNEQGAIADQVSRHKVDLTGNMKILHEGV